MKLSEALKNLSARLFPTVDGVRQPNYRGIFVEAVGAILQDAGVKYSESTLQAVADHVNLSSFQRGTAAECARRYGTVVDGERVVREPAPKAKVKKAKPNPIDGGLPKKAPRGVDPITGEKKAKAKKAAKPSKEAKPTKEAAPKKTEKTEKKAKPAKKAPAVDPITGEPVAASTK